MMRNFAFSVFTFFCVATVSQLTAQQLITFNPKTTDKGLIFGSITFPKEKAHFNEYFIQISYKAADKKTARKNFKEVHISPAQIFKMKHKGELDNGLTYLFAIERPAGESEIIGIRLFSNSGFAILQKNSGLGGFSIPFNVNKGEILYVGNILFNEYAEKGEVAVNYQNNFEKDLTGIKNVQKYVYWDAAKDDKTIKISYNKEE
ncbi:hypothetical protein [Flavobacterium chungbukense]|uniref:Uncharacterized protein n=1 Tax=Flavobacterium chungbukense TaxID=877464 RepID=A0ABP7XPG8_9FLAO|nr:hypothetical protein [Flavobacterium chungbukense]MCC4920924.1 hypothetical protein [Flavobacterium chungbukense]